MIKALRIKNFKCLHDTGEMPFRPLTFLVGPNSSGKTSIFQLLLMMKASTREYLRRLITVDDTIPLDLGSADEMILGHDRENALTIELVFTKQSISPILASFLFKVSGKPAKGFVLSKLRLVRHGEKQRGKLQLLRWEGIPVEMEPEIPELITKMWEGPGEAETLRLASKLEKLKKTRPSSRDTALAVSMIVDILLNEVLINGVLLNDLEKIRWKAPLRAEPQRVYWSTGASLTIGPKGEYMADVLQQEFERLKSFVKKWMKTLEVGATFRKPRSLSRKLSRFEVVVEDTRQGIRVNIKDVGFGISQVMPILVEGTLAPEGSLLMIEQPELHLHPKSQAAMGEVLADMAGVLSSPGPGRKPKRVPAKTLLIETHSDLILARVGRLIAEGRVKHEDCLIYYFDPTEKGTTLNPILFDNEGAFFAENADGEKALDQFLDEFLGADYIEFAKTVEKVEEKRNRQKKKQK